MRRGGWSAARQTEFIAALAETGSVRAACRQMGVGEHHIYKLRNHPEAESFRKAWEAALDMGIARIEDVAMDRALYGTEAPVFWQGEQVGTRPIYNDRLLMFLLANRSPKRFPRSGNGRSTGMGGLNAVGQMELERVKKQWRAEWEAEQRKVSPAEIRASIDRKIEEIRLRLEREHAVKWAMLSEETRAAWDAFTALRDRDLDAMEAAPDLRRNLTRSPFSTTPEPRAPLTEWTVMDDDFGKA
jgi:hypothetical protein